MIPTVLFDSNHSPSPRIPISTSRRVQATDRPQSEMAPKSPLHPRSLSTTSLFSTTLALAFLVVAAPHVVPCPVRPPIRARQYRADEEGDGVGRFERNGEQGKRRRRTEDMEQRKGKRKCPIPRSSGGLVEEWMRLKGVLAGHGDAGLKEGRRVVVFEERPGVREG